MKIGTYVGYRTLFKQIIMFTLKCRLVNQYLLRWYKNYTYKYKNTNHIKQQYSFNLRLISYELYILQLRNCNFSRIKIGCESVVVRLMNVKQTVQVNICYEFYILMLSAQNIAGHRLYSQMNFYK